MFGTIIGLLKSGAEALATFLRLRERSKNEEAGANAENLKQRERADAVRDAMDGVEPGGKSGTSDGMRRGKY